MTADGANIKKDQVKNKASERVRKLVKAVGREVVNRKGLIATLGLRQQGIRNFRMNYMLPAREEGYVVMQYARTPHYHEQHPRGRAGIPPAHISHAVRHAGSPVL